VARELGTREALECFALRRKAQPLVLRGRNAYEPGLEEPGGLRLDQLAADGLQERVDDRGRSDRPHSSEGLDRVPDQRVVAEPAQELAVIVVGGEDEAELRQRLFGLCTTRARAGASPAS
jgi:hypothetical protein